MDLERNAQEVCRLKVMLDECHSIIKHLKYEKKGDHISHVAMIHRLLKEKDELSRMVDTYSREMQQKLDEVEVTNKSVQEDHDKVDEGAKRTSFEQLFGESLSKKARGVTIVEHVAEGQSSRPTEVTAKVQNSRPRVPEVEAKSSKPSEVDDKVEGIETLLNMEEVLERQ
ncbi:hypothetical protein ACE6H2_015769 [Prunus campanulata]